MADQFPAHIRVVFNEYGPHVPYAASLAEELNVPLVVHIPADERSVRVAADLFSTSPLMLGDKMRVSVVDAARCYFTNKVRARIATTIGPANESGADEKSILVSCDTDLYREANTLSPAGEEHVFRRNKGPILIPLGDGHSGIFAASRGVELAKRLDTNVIFWHTTWHNEEVGSSDPRKHVCREAEYVLTEAERVAKNSGVPHEEVRVECANTIVEGIIRVALYSGASLVVMARGKRKKYGAYPDRVRDRNCPVPLLILAKEKP